MSEPQKTSNEESAPAERKNPEKKKKRHWFRKFSIAFLVLAFLLIMARAAMPVYVRWYVNRTIDKNPLYDGQIGEIDIHLYRGAYSIHDIRLIKTTGTVPVPLFSSKRLDLALEWKELLHGKIVGRVVMDQPELNFVDSGDESQSQTGAGGPWLDMLRELTPFKLNALFIKQGSIHFRAFDRDPPVDVYLSHLDASLENLTNVRDETRSSFVLRRAAPG